MKTRLPTPGNAKIAPGADFALSGDGNFVNTVGRVLMPPSK